jgi:hypothetical protein
MLIGASPALATFHSFDVEEIFSNLDGTVQFVELRETEGLNGQSQFQDKSLSSNATSLVFPTDLSGSTTAFRNILIATPGFALLPGAVTPDFTMPAGFIQISGDTISLRLDLSTDPVDSLTFTAGQLPLDGTLALLGSGTTAPNSPTNFDGDTGSISVGPTVPAASTIGLLIFGGLLAAVGAVVIRRKKRQLS